MIVYLFWWFVFVLYFNGRTHMLSVPITGLHIVRWFFSDSDVNNILRGNYACTWMGKKKQQALMNQATCIVLIHQQHSLAHEEKRTFDDMTIIDTKLSKKLI